MTTYAEQGVWSREDDSILSTNKNIQVRISNPFRYSFREPYMSVSCIFKCWFGSSYLICKAKALHQNVNQMSIEIDRRFRLGVKPGDMYQKVVQKIKAGRVTIFEVEVLKESEVPSELLIYEKKLLTAAKNDPKCLNVSFDPYIPKWISQEEVNKYLEAIKPKPVAKIAQKGKKKTIRRPGKKNPAGKKRDRKGPKNSLRKKARR